MKDEIKEILKYIDQFVYIDQTYNDIKLSKIDVKLILDYITNLQEEKDKYKNIIDELEEELERETNIKEEDTGLEHNTYLDINQTLKKVLNRLKELKGE